MIIENSFDNKEIIKINRNEKSIYLGSKYNMTREVAKLLDEIKKINKSYEIIIFGAAGGGWIKDSLDELIERHIVIVEPFEEIKLELEKKINNLNIDIKVLSLDSENFKKQLKKCIDRRFVEFIAFSNYDLTFPTDVYNLKETIKEIVIDKSIDENTLILFSKSWFENYLNNLTSIITSERLNVYKNVYENKPAIIVSAGPSLEKNIQLLKGNENKFIIITGLRTLSTLMKEGIKPDFACVIDGGEMMYKVSKESLNYDIPLFYSESANKKVINDYKGKKIYFSSPNFYLLSRKLGQFETDLLFQGGSVAHSCTAIAHYLGCNPIIFMGQDLAFTNNQRHAKNATIQGEILEAEKYDVYVKDVYGNQVPTSFSLDSFRKTFEDFINMNNERTYINATEGGADIKGTEIKKLNEVINEFTKNIDKSYIKETKENNLDISLMINNLNKNLKEIKKMKKFAEDSVFENKNLLDKFFKSKRDFKNSLDKLDYIDKKFQQGQREFLLMNTLFAPIIKEIDIAFYDDKIENFQDEAEHVKFVADKGKMLYENINSCIEYAIPYIEKTVKKLEESLNEPSGNIGITK